MDTPRKSMTFWTWLLALNMLLVLGARATEIVLHDAFRANVDLVPNGMVAPVVILCAAAIVALYRLRT